MEEEDDMSHIKRDIKILEIKKPYKVTDKDGQIHEYISIKSIAQDYNQNMSTIYRMIKGRRYPNLSFSVDKEELPYVWRFMGDKTIHRSHNLKDISKECNYSVSHISKMALPHGMRWA